jgi:hypothetical protein
MVSELHGSVTESHAAGYKFPHLYVTQIFITLLVCSQVPSSGYCPEPDESTIETVWS